jgi:hypothetical protein
LLRLVTVDSQRRPSILSQEFGKVVGDSLGTNENQNLAVLLGNLIEVLDKLVSLLKVSADFDDLLDVVVGGQVH